MVKISRRQMLKRALAQVTENAKSTGNETNAKLDAIHDTLKKANLGTTVIQTPQISSTDEYDAQKKLRGQ